MRWRRNARRDVGNWYTIFALVPHLCYECDSWFWFEFGRRYCRAIYFGGYADYRHRCSSCVDG